MLGAGRWAKEERGGGRGSDLPVSLLALGKILKQSLFLISLSACLLFLSFPILRVLWPSAPRQMAT